MPRKGMRDLFFSSKNSSSPSQSPSVYDSVGDEGLINRAESMITKWDPEGSTFAKVTSLFHENRREAKDFIKCVNDLQKHMHFLVSVTSGSDMLVRSQSLMEIAMKRLQKEFYQILSSNRAHLDPESVSSRWSRGSARSSTSEYTDDEGTDNDVRNAETSISEVELVSSIAMTDLRSIAECMIMSGYGKECSQIYKIVRKSIIDEGIYRLGVEKISSSEIHKMDWEVVELKVQNWLEAVKVAVKTLFTGERILCDHVFASSQTMKESCFTEISTEGATLLFGYPEVITRCKSTSPEKMIRLLDLYTSLSVQWPEIDSIFAFESTSTIRSKALTSLVKLADSVCSLLADLAHSIEKDSSKSLAPGGGVHALTQRVMNQITLLADYSTVLADILSDSPLPDKPPLPESYFETSDSDDSPAPVVSVRLAWLILLLLCKLDGRAKQYKDVSLSYLFLANNLRHVLTKVRTSNLRYLIGDDWISKHETKIKQFTSNYERLGWSKVFTALPEDPTAAMSPAEVKESFKRFNSAFEQAHQKQSSWIVPDPKLRDEIKISIVTKLIPAYRAFYDTHRITLASPGIIQLFVKFAPEDLGNYLSDLFYGTSTSTSSSSSSSHHWGSSWSGR